MYLHVGMYIYVCIGLVSDVLLVLRRADDEHVKC
jgi:hypothetical protein